MVSSSRERGYAIFLTKTSLIIRRSDLMKEILDEGRTFTD